MGRHIIKFIIWKSRNDRETAVKTKAPKVLFCTAVFMPENALKNLFKKNKKNLKIVLTFRETHGILYFVAGENTSEDTKESTYGVWLSLARAPGLGPGGRRFESCHPDFAGVVQW